MLVPTDHRALVRHQAELHRAAAEQRLATAALRAGRGPRATSPRGLFARLAFLTRSGTEAAPCRT